MYKRTICIALISAIFSGFICFDVSAQNTKVEEDKIRATINTLFDGMREADGELVRSVFEKGAIMQTATTDEEGNGVLRTGSLENFIKAVGGQRDEVWDERIDKIDIRLDFPLASVWVPYEFYRGKVFSHCGVNSFQMINKNDTWKIIHIVDTRRPSNCKL